MNLELLKKTIQRLEDKLLVDRDVMEADDVEDLLENIAALKKMLPTENSELVGCYCHNEDKTFVMKYTYIGRELHTAECVGWYCGEPNDRDNEAFSNGNLFATYE